MGKKKKIDVSGGDTGFGVNAFGGLSSAGLPEGKAVTSTPKKKVEPSKKSRGRLDVGREKSGRGGKWVTVVRGEGFTHTNPQELEKHLKQLKGRFGCGGTLKGKVLEIQGDQREAVSEFFSAMGYRTVFVGG